MKLPVLPTIALASSMLASAATAATAQPFPSPSPRQMQLARQFIAITERPEDVTGTMHDMIMQAFGGPKPPEDPATADRVFSRFLAMAEPKLKERMPALQETFAEVYAREFSAEELKGMIAFARTPAGKHYLARFPVLNLDPKIVAAQDRLRADFIPIFVRLHLELCMERAAARLAAGEKDARCPLLRPPRPPSPPPAPARHGREGSRGSCHSASEGCSSPAASSAERRLPAAILPRRSSSRS